jgi:hypothetical protein
MSEFINTYDTNRANEIASFYFKIAYTNQTTILDVPTNICTKNFICFVKNDIYERLNIDRNLNIEIVEAGQDSPNMVAEEAPAFRGHDNITVRQKYNGFYDNVAFYIRILPQ